MWIGLGLKRYLLDTLMARQSPAHKNTLLCKVYKQTATPMSKCLAHMAVA